MPSPLIEQVKRLRAAQEAQEAAELERLVRAYAGIDKAARSQAEALALKLMQAYDKDGRAPSQSQIQRMSRYRELMDTITQELEQYQVFMRVELRTQSGLAITAGEVDARTLAQLAAREVGFSAQFRALNPAVIEQLVGFLDPQGPLYKRLGQLSGWTAEQVSEGILQGVGLGLNPRTTAAMLTKKLTDGVTDRLGMGLSDALRMMRTTQLYSYREANRASYVANQDVVRGWVWMADLSQACAACVAMHGTEHTLDETLDDHHNGHCAMAPIVIGARNPIETSGVDWFDNINEEQQKGILGETKWQAWKNGKFTLAEVVGQNENDVFGLMRSERSLKDLLGE